MSMSKKDFIALADRIKRMDTQEAFVTGVGHNGIMVHTDIQAVDLDDVIGELAAFCEEANPRFNRDRWMDYIDGKCGPNGGKVKVS